MSENMKRSGERAGPGEMTDDLLLRYSRQIMLPDFDVEKQEALRQSSALIVGLGGLGCPAALYLAAAGCGHLLLADFDEVEVSNLQRQISHAVTDIGKNKAESVASTIAQLNPDIQVSVVTDSLSGDQLSQAVKGVDVVLDCTDNFSTRDEVNRKCVEHSVPLVSGAAIRTEGQLIVFDPREPQSPCYHCLYGQVDDEQLTCSEAGVLGPVVGIIGSMQALEAIKVLTNYGEAAVGKLLVFDAKYMSWRDLKVNKDPDCLVCS